MFSGVAAIDGILVFLLTILFTQLIQKNASKIGMLDIPNNRSSHTAPTPRGAGIGMFLAYFLVLSFFHTAFVLEYSGFFIAITLIFLLGVYDDAKDTSPKLKLLIIGMATTLIFFVDGFEINTLGHWFGVEVTLPYIVALFVTLFAVAGFTNALNLVDGLDGLAGSLSLVILASLYYIGYAYNDQFIMIVSFFVMVSLLGFLLFNWYPASIFMGDSGSLVLGFIISVLSIKTINYVSDTAILFLAAVPIIDTIIVMTRRMQRGFSPFAPDKSHFHHKILMLRGSVDASVHILVALQVILSVIGLLLRDKSDAINLVLFMIILFVFFQALDDRK
ncbi:MAG TPA: undecaprenyl/decaprenyl-phosphate alpha-N-acetylglucosaminyl 1-phosphate transferase, partial [Campylobacterales bacterium]|nr:undecaprenyl/decaprenyl-phosphate alpha-N-acetylglucosaminyl 1-phosphate transferase [Campylobacterales bacterium]